MITRANIYIDQNVEFDVDLELFDEIGYPYDIQRSTFYSSLKKLYSTTVFLDFFIAKSAGKITLSLTENQTSLLKEGKYQYDVIMIAEDGDTFKIVEGLAFVSSTISSIPERS